MIHMSQYSMSKSFMNKGGKNACESRSLEKSFAHNYYISLCDTVIVQ